MISPEHMIYRDVSEPIGMEMNLAIMSLILYNYLKEPWKCQKWIRTIVDRFYGNTPDALSGNDDCGQMSAWYMFNCIGFYPVAPFQQYL